MGLWFVVLCLAAPEGSICSGSDFKASQKTWPRLKLIRQTTISIKFGTSTCLTYISLYTFVNVTSLCRRISSDKACHFPK